MEPVFRKKIICPGWAPKTGIFRCVNRKKKSKKKFFRNFSNFFFHFFFQETYFLPHQNSWNYTISRPENFFFLCDKIVIFAWKNRFGWKYGTIILIKWTKKNKKKIFPNFFQNFSLIFFFKKTNFFPPKNFFFVPKICFHFFFLSKNSLN